MNPTKTDLCCSRFDPGPWDDKTVRWENRRFVKDRVRSFLHVPLNFGSVMKRNMEAIESAGARVEGGVVLSDETSLWGADVYIEVAKDIPGMTMTSLSGTFLCKVFEGPYKNMRKWIGDMNALVAARAQRLRKMYFYYTTCPRCAKTFGKNYIVILAQI